MSHRAAAIFAHLLDPDAAARLGGPHGERCGHGENVTTAPDRTESTVPIGGRWYRWDGLHFCLVPVE